MRCQRTYINRAPYKPGISAGLSGGAYDVAAIPWNTDTAQAPPWSSA